MWPFSVLLSIKIVGIEAVKYGQRGVNILTHFAFGDVYCTQSVHM
jgi:hypothetical protein